MNIQIYLDDKKLPNEYSNIFGFHKKYSNIIRIIKNIHILEYYLNNKKYIIRYIFSCLVFLLWQSQIELMGHYYFILRIFDKCKKCDIYI